MTAALLRALTLTVDEKSYADNPALREHAVSRLTPLPLPESQLIADTDWRTVRRWEQEFLMIGAKPPLEALDGQREVAVARSAPGPLHARRAAASCPSRSTAAARPSLCRSKRRDQEALPAGASPSSTTTTCTPRSPA